MNVRFFLITLVFLLVSSIQVYGQTSESPYVTSLSATFLDYMGPINGNYTDFNSFSPGISIGAYGYISPALNFGLNSSFVPQTTYPLTTTETIGTSLIDVNGLIMLKSNGTIFKEDAFFAPYLASGFGLNTASNNLRLYVPGALGIRLRMSKNFSVNFEGMYKYGFQKGSIQPLTYTAGFVFALPSNKKPVKKTAPPEKQPKEKMPIAANADSDNDGVVDRDDLCPNEPGKAMHLGCPEEETTTTDKPQDIALQNNDAELNTTQNDNVSIVDNPANDNANSDRVEVEPYPQNTDNTGYEDDTYSDGQGISPADQSILNTAMNNIYFERASDELKYESYEVLDQVASLLEKYPNHSLEVLGFTDNSGNSRDNKVLSVKRAYKVKYYLVYEKGIRMARITSDGHGSDSPVSDNNTAAGREKNRRVELKMTKSQDALGLRSN